MICRSAFLILLATFAFSTPVVAQGTVQSGVSGASGGNCSFEDFKGNLGQSEGGYGSVNGQYLGRYQMGNLALREAGLKDKNNNWLNGMSDAKFLGSPQIQDQAYNSWSQKNWGYIKSVNGQSLLGQKLSDGTVITQSSLLKAGQFGQERIGAYVNNGGVCDKTTSDDNGVCVAEYMRSGSGFDVSNITGMQSDVNGECKSTGPTQEEEKWTGDTTSKTCIPTVPMLQSIPCEIYPTSLQGFCYRWKPLQMNMPMCQAAERWAENVPPSGPHLESCKTQTFRDGTSSWSYVHACAKAEPAMGAKGQDKEDQKIIGAADDPACYERLKGMGVQFEALGKMDISTGGRTCIIPNAVQYSGHGIPFDRSVTLNCALVEELENFAGQARSMGVQQYKVLLTLDCRGINNTKGSNQKKTSLHGTGNAIDINGFQTGSGLIKTSEYFSNAERRQWLEQLKIMGCSNFDGTLAFNFYKQQWTHIHWQATESTRCDPPG